MEELARLRMLVEIGLADHVGHARLDDLEPVVLEVALDLVVGAEMEIEQVLAHDENGRMRVRAVVRNGVHDRKRAFEARRLASQPGALHALDNLIERAVERSVRRALLELVGTDAPKHGLEGIDHGKTVGDLDARAKAELEARMRIVGIDVVVGEHRDIVVSRVVERAAQQGHVVRQAAVADILASHHGDVVRVVLTALECRERLADHDLRGEADVVVHIAFAQADGILAPDIKGLGAHALIAHRRGHEPAERMGGVGDQRDLVVPVALGVLDLIRVVERMDRVHPGALGTLLRATTVDRLDKRTHANAHGTGDVALIELDHHRNLGAHLAHHARDLVGEIRIVAAAEAAHLHELELGRRCDDDRARQHARMVVVHDVDAAVGKIDVADPRHRIGRQHGDAALREELGQPVVDQRVVVVRARSDHHRVAAVLVHVLEHLPAAQLQLVLKRLLRAVRLLGRLGNQVGIDIEGLLAPRLELAVSVALVVPVEQRRIERNAETLLRVIGIAHHVGVSLYDGAHPLAGRGGVFGGHRRDDGHEDAVDAGVDEIADVPVDELGREAHGVGCDVRQTALVHRLGAASRDAHLKAERAEERRPERHGVPELEHTGNADRDIAPPADGNRGVRLEQQLLAVDKEIGGSRGPVAPRAGCLCLASTLRTQLLRRGNLAHELIP